MGITIRRKHKNVKNILKVTSHNVKKCSRKKEIKLEQKDTEITNKIDLSVIQKILSLKINSIKPS